MIFQIETYSHLISYVDSSNAATVCLTSSGSMLLYTKYKLKTLKKPIIYESIKHVVIVGGEFVNTNGQDKSKSFTF